MPKKSPGLFLGKKPKDLSEEQYINRIKIHFDLTAKKWIIIAVFLTFIVITLVTYGLLVAASMGVINPPANILDKLAWGALMEIAGFITAIIGYFFRK